MLYKECSDEMKKVILKIYIIFGKMKKSKSIMEKYVYVGKNGVVKRDVYIKRKEKKWSMFLFVSFTLIHLNISMKFTNRLMVKK